jgi:15-cis-phytoene synthase
VGATRRSAVNRLALYSTVAHETAAVVIRRYSTSFGAASRLLAPDVRRNIDDIYALVRIADEIVDGAAKGAGLDTVTTARLLNDFERETELAIAVGFSTNPVIHAFAETAREVGFGSELTSPFFESMRMDLARTVHDDESFSSYVYGSAEVVGLMCLRAFLNGVTVSVEALARLEAGARALGAAFQKINFLRDLGVDFETLGRSYFPGLTVTAFSDADKERLLDDIDADLRTSGAVIPELPTSSRRAVVLAHSLFFELSRRLRRTPASTLVRTRIRVPGPVKMRIGAGATLGRGPSR